MVHAFRVVALCAPVALAGCQVDVLSDIYLSDVRAIRDGSAALPAAMRLAFEVPSQNECQKAADSLTGPLSAHFTAATYSGCREVEFRTFADFDVETQMVAELANGKSDSLKPVYVGIFQEKDTTFIEIHSNDTTLAALFNSIPEDLQNQIGSQGFTVSARIINDTPKALSVSVANVFVDGNPYPFPSDIELARRGEITVSGSDVANAAFAKGARLFIAALNAGPQG
jgi:hypothetical protein